MFEMGRYPSAAYLLVKTAVDNSDLRLAEWLVTHGASPNATTSAPPRSKPKRPLHEEALRQGFTEMAGLLVRYGAIPTAMALDGEDAFVAACLRLDREEVRALLAQQPEYLVSPKAMGTAALRDRADVVAFLLDLGDVSRHRGSRTWEAAPTARGGRQRLD